MIRNQKIGRGTLLSLPICGITGLTKSLPPGLSLRIHVGYGSKFSSYILTRTNKRDIIIAEPVSGTDEEENFLSCPPIGSLFITFIKYARIDVLCGSLTLNLK